MIFFSFPLPFEETRTKISVKTCQIDAWVGVFLCARIINLTDLLTSSLVPLLIIWANSLKSLELIARALENKVTFNCSSVGQINEIVKPKKVLLLFLMYYYQIIYYFSIISNLKSRLLIKHCIEKCNTEWKRFYTVPNPLQEDLSTFYNGVYITLSRFRSCRKSHVTLPGQERSAQQNPKMFVAIAGACHANNQ